MYSFEIAKYLQEHNFRITPIEFLSIINSSPQIKYVGYDISNSMYIITSDDGLSINVEIIEEPIKKLKYKRGDN